MRMLEAEFGASALPESVTGKILDIEDVIQDEVTA